MIKYWSDDDHVMMYALSNSDSGLQQTSGKLSWIPHDGDTSTTALYNPVYNVHTGDHVQLLPTAARGIYALLYAWHKP